MDKIIESQVRVFCEQFQIASREESVRFEHFVNYCTFMNVNPGAYSVARDPHLKVHTGQGGDCGIDGVLVLINDSPVFSVEEARGLINGCKYKKLDVEFVFTQAKTSAGFDSGDMLKTREGVLQFFSDDQMDCPGALQAARDIKDLIYENSALFGDNPKCTVYFVTTGRWTADKVLAKVVDEAEKALVGTNLFSEVGYRPVDAAGLQKLYKNLTNSITKTIKFDKRQTFPEISGTSQSYIGLIDGCEFVEMISHDGRLNKAIFYENVRAFLGDNSVNKEIAATLESQEIKQRFPLLNNGVTIVARELNSVGDKLTLKDFQIVNGCQTSYVLYAHKDKLDGVMVPAKIIASDDQEVINMIIRSTNRQTEVTAEAFESIKEIQKGIQDYYNTFTCDDRLYYERRNREYDRNNAGAIPRARVFTIPMQVKSHVAVFLSKPHDAEQKYYGQLLRDNAAVLFGKDDLPVVYYTSARLVYKVERAVNKLSDKTLRDKVKAFRYHLALIMRLLLQGDNEKLPQMNSHKIEKLCKKILAGLENTVELKAKLSVALGILTECIEKISDGNGNFVQSKLTDEILSRRY